MKTSSMRLIYDLISMAKLASCSQIVVVLCLSTFALAGQTLDYNLSWSSKYSQYPQQLIQGVNGNLYGTAAGTGVNSQPTAGAVFEMTPNGDVTALYFFCVNDPNCETGREPMGRLYQSPEGTLYGTTEDGGGRNGTGVIFKINLQGKLSILHTFQNTFVDAKSGELPIGGLVQARNGELYGTTLYGGANDTATDSTFGTIFKITTGGVLTTLYSFCSQPNCSDGVQPWAALVQAVNGDLYGTTLRGGANGAYGTVFKITPAGQFTSLYSFCSEANCADGELPYGGLVQAPNGDLYGTTSQGGANGAGTIYRITPAGKLTTLYSFCSKKDCVDGGQPYAGLIYASNGQLYGTTFGSGLNLAHGGTIYKISPGGAFSRVYTFCDNSACEPEHLGSGLLQYTDGSFYGTTAGSQKFYDQFGSVFHLSVGLKPFVRTQTSSGKVGTPIYIQGNDLVGATQVTFNGTAAEFTIQSNTQIATQVPSGATNGIVRVVTPNGTLESSMPFTVTK